MKKILFTLILFIGCIMVYAQQPQRPQRPQRGQMPNFEKYLEDRISFVTGVMKLSAADSVKFVPLYKEKLKAKGELMMKSHHYRIMPNQQYPDSIYTNAAMAETQYKIDDAKIDMEYLKKFEKVLTPKQLFTYQQAEKMFVGSFMNRAGGPRGGHGGPNKQGQNPGKPSQNTNAK